MNTPEPVKSGLDLIGLGKLAQAIPPEVYKMTAATALNTFESLVAPFTESFAGLGRLIRQKFDNWVEDQKALGTYSLQQALLRAKGRAEKEGKSLHPPLHAKTFLHALEEASLETDLVLHEMWVNLLASEFVDGKSHPRFVSILAQLGPAEAKLLASLQPLPKGLSGYIGGNIAHTGMNVLWVATLDQPKQPWNLSGTILCQQSLADVAPLDALAVKSDVLLHLTPFGQEFLTAVAPQH